MLRFKGLKSEARRRAVETGDPNVDGWLRAMRPYRKISVTYAIRISERFQVHTLEGLHDGKAGDWLAIGQAGEMYPIDGEVFAATYEEIT